MNFVLIEKVVIAKSNIILDVKPWDDETGEVCRFVYSCVSLRHLVCHHI